MAIHRSHSDYISQVRALCRLVQEIEYKNDYLRAEWDVLYNAEIVDATGSDPNAEGYDPGDFAPNNEGLTKADIANALTGLAVVCASIREQYVNFVRVA